MSRRRVSALFRYLEMAHVSRRLSGLTVSLGELADLLHSGSLVGAYRTASMWESIGYTAQRGFSVAWTKRIESG